jgi:hypothetical protein
MFPRIWERAVAFFERILLAAFAEAERRADATIAQRFENPGQSTAPAAAPLSPPAQPQLPLPHQPPSLPVPLPPQQVPAAPVLLPPHPPTPATVDAGAPQASPATPPRRPRGRPRKEQPPC